MDAVGIERSRQHRQDPKLGTSRPGDRYRWDLVDLLVVYFSLPFFEIRDGLCFKLIVPWLWLFNSFGFERLTSFYFFFFLGLT